jgi:hypothetical protein
VRTQSRTTRIPSLKILRIITPILAVVWMLPALGCRTMTPPVETYDAYPAIRDDLSPELAQLLLQDYSAAATSSVDLAMQEIVDGAVDPDDPDDPDDPLVIDQALRFRAAAVSEIRRAALRVNPIAGALDSWVLLEQIRWFLLDGSGAEAFRGNREIVERMITSIGRDLDVALDRMLEDRELAKKLVDSIAGAHPLSSMNLSRPSVVSPVANDDDRLRTLMDAVASLEFLAHAAYYRLGAAIDDLPRDLRWQSEMVVRDVLEDPRVAEAIKSLDALDGDMRSVAQAISEMPASLDSNGGAIVASITTATQTAMTEALAGIALERAAITAAIREERLAAQVDIERQRLETIEVLQAERALVLKVVTAEREAIEAAIARERVAVMTDFREMISEETVTAADTIRNAADASIDRAMGWLFIGILLATVGAVVAGVVLIFVARQSRRPA